MWRNLRALVGIWRHQRRAAALEKAGLLTEAREHALAFALRVGVADDLESLFAFMVLPPHLVRLSDATRCWVGEAEALRHLLAVMAQLPPGKPLPPEHQRKRDEYDAWLRQRLAWLDANVPPPVVH